MKIKIAHLYYDLLNLYGEQGNVLALKKALEAQKVKVEVSLLSIGDKIEFDKYDIFYMGMGTEENLSLVIEDIKNYAKEIESVIKKGKYFIATGNSYELFGQFIEMNGQKYQTLDIFDYHSKANPKRIAGASFLQFKDLSPIIGFQNRLCCTINEKNHLFKLIDGYADNSGSEYEGYHEKNFFGTHQVGPIFIRNPHLTDYIVKDIVGKKYKPRKEDIQYQAYSEYIKNFYEKS